MLRATTNLSPISSPTLSALRFSLVPTLTFASPSHLRSISSSPPSFHSFLSRPISLTQPYVLFSSSIRVSPFRCAKAAASNSSGNGSVSAGREILVQHLLVKDDDLKLLIELQKRIADGEDMSDLALEYSICPSKREGGMLGWVKQGQMVPEFEEASFSAPINHVVRCKTQFGWHLLQVLSEREVLQEIQVDALHEKMQDPSFIEEAQLIDVREPDEITKASLPGFHVLSLRQFGSWGSEITSKFDPEKDTYVMCHHGVRSLQVAKWLQTQGFKRVFNVAGGIHAYALKADPSVPTY